MEVPRQPETMTPADHLSVIRNFIQTTSDILIQQVDSLELTRPLHSPDYVNNLWDSIADDARKNVTALNEYYEAFRQASPRGFNIVHENLDRPAQLVAFLEFDLESRAYGVGIASGNMHGLWTLSSTNDIQLL